MSTKLDERTRREIPPEALSHYEVILDNATTRITFHRIRPGEQSGWHQHADDYVGYHMATSDLSVEFGDGRKDKMISKEGVATFYEVGDGFEHNVTNVSDCDMIALEIEYKRPAE
jgi:mannose-6-phosphate isomerase-like protein (cupin superfamily)